MKFKEILIFFLVIITLILVFYVSNRYKKVNISEGYKGVNTHLSRDYFDDSEKNIALNLIKDGRIKWIRDDSFSWTNIEKTKDTYEWSKADSFVNSVENYNLKILGILESTSQWANGQNKDVLTCLGFNWWWAPPSNSSEFGNYVYQTVSRYKDRVHTWEVWNEPNLQSFWSGTSPNPIKYTELLKEAYINSKRADPDSLIIAGSLASIKSKNTIKKTNCGNINIVDMDPVTFLRGMYESGAKGYFDVLSIHFYDDSYKTILPEIHKLMEEHGDGNKPIWITELGYSSCQNIVFDFCIPIKRQDKKLVDSYQTIYENYPYVSRIFWYNLYDENEYEPENFGGKQFGLLTYDLKPKASYFSMKGLTHFEDI